MDKILSMVETPAGWNDHFNIQHGRWRKNQNFDSILLILAAFCLIAAALTYFTGGLHAGFYGLHELGHQLLPAALWENITFIGDTMVALTILLLFAYRFPQITVATLIAALVGTLLIHGFKQTLDSSRPPLILDRSTFEILGPVYKKSSMPSGHTATAFILATLLTRCVNSIHAKLLIIVAACFVGWSRVVCGVHWPTDVLCGAAIGLFSGWFALRYSDRIRIGIKSYTAINSLLVTSAILLINYDGGFENTKTFAQILAMGSLFYFGICLLLHYFDTRLWVNQSKPTVD